MSDRKLYRALSTKFDRCTLVAGGGKGEAIKLRQVLQEALAAYSASLKVVALLDRDIRNGAHADPSVSLLPVSMIENFLVDPDAIWQAIQSVIEKTDLRAQTEIAGALDEIVAELADRELERRVLGALGIAVFRPHGPVGGLDAQVAAHIDEVQRGFSKEAVERATTEARGAVEKIKVETKRRELFDGKEILNEFMRRKLHASGMSRAIFMYETARHASKRKSVASFFDGFFVRLLGPEGDDSNLKGA